MTLLRHWDASSVCESESVIAVENEKSNPTDVCKALCWTMHYSSEGTVLGYECSRYYTSTVSKDHRSALLLHAQ